MSYVLRVTHPLDESVQEAMIIPFGSGDDITGQINQMIPGVVEALEHAMSGMDDLIAEIVGQPPSDTGAGFGDRDLFWPDLDWETVTTAAKKLLELPRITICIRKTEEP